MSALGETFRKQREASGISLEEIADDSKISIRFLRAIEKERFDLLPGGIFNRSFVRQYARYLGMDEEVAVREYLQATGHGTENPVPPQPGVAETPVVSVGSSYLRIVLAAVCLGALLGGMAYGLYRFKGPFFSWLSGRRTPVSVSLPPPPLSPPAATAPLPAVGSASQPSPAARRDLPASSAAKPATATVPESSLATSPAEGAGAGLPSEGLQLRIDSGAPVWLSITTDGQKQWQGTLRANQSRQVQATDSIRLTVGDAAAVELILNGKSLPSLGRSGEVKTLTITAQDAATSSP